MRMAYSIPVRFTVTAGLAVAGLSASGVSQSPVLADPPVAYFRLGEAPGYTIAVDLSANARDVAPEGTSGLKVLEWDVPFTIEAWVQLIDHYHFSKIFEKVETGGGYGYGVGISLSAERLSAATDFAVLTPLTDNLSEARGVLGYAVIPYFAPRSARKKSKYRDPTVFETSAMTSCIGLVLILFAIVSRRWRGPLNFRGGGAGLSRPSVLKVGVLNFRKRSEPELNSFSACYATIEVRATRPRVASPSRPRRSNRYAETHFRSGLDPEVRRALAAGHQ